MCLCHLIWQYCVAFPAVLYCGVMYSHKGTFYKQLNLIRPEAEIWRQRGSYPPHFITSPQELDFAIQINPVKPLLPPRPKYLPLPQKNMAIPNYKVKVYN